MRVAASILAALLWAAAAAAAAGGESVELVNEVQGSDGKIGVSVRPVLGRWYRPGEPAPLSIVVTNSGPPVKATVAVVTSGGSGIRCETARARSLSGRVPVLLSPCLSGPGEPPVVEVTSAEGGVIFRAPVEGLLKALGDSERLVVFTADHLLQEMSVRAPSGRMAGGLTARVVELHSGALPPSAVDYAGVDLLIIDDMDPARLSSRQKEALATWVRSGGSFIISSWQALDGLRGLLFARHQPGERLDWESWKRIYGGSDSDVVLRRDGKAAIVRVRSGLGRGVIFGFSVRGSGKAEWAGVGAQVYRELLAGAARRGGDTRIRPGLFDVLPPRGEFSEVILRIRAAAVAFVVVLGILIGLTFRRGRGRLFVLATVGGTSVLLALAACVFVPRPVASTITFSVAEVAADGSAIMRRTYAQVTAFAGEGESISSGELRPGSLPRVLAWDWSELRSHSYVVARGDGVRISGLAASRELPALVEVRAPELSSSAAALRVAPPGTAGWALRHGAAGDLSPGALFALGRVRRMPAEGEAAYGEPQGLGEYLGDRFGDDEARRKITRHFAEEAARRGESFIFGWRERPPGAGGALRLGSGREVTDLRELVIVYLEEAGR